MELAGLSVACAVAAVWPVASKVLTVCGPGNNGGDALVSARHLYHFGYKPVVLYPKAPKESGNGILYRNLLQQCKDLDIPVIDSVPESISQHEYDVVLDGVFGFSFNGSNGVRAPYDKVMQVLKETNVPIASIDVPSGWDVEQGDAHGDGIKPSMLVSLTAPKLCASTFKGEHHYLGGRFLPPKLAVKYNLQGLPEYPGTDQCVRLESECKM